MLIINHHPNSYQYHLHLHFLIHSQFLSGRMSITGVTLEQIVDEKEIFLKLETHNHNIKEETEIHLKA